MDNETIAIVAAIMIAIVSMVASQAKAQGIDDMIVGLKNDGDALIAEIENTDLNGTGVVEDLINKVYYYEGQVSAMGGGTWAYLHDVQDALLAKIKATGESAFTIPEQSAIEFFATKAEQSKLEHPSSNVFG
jgi:hypothetical protein